METITLAVNTTVDENNSAEEGEGLSLREAIDIANQSPENNYIIELQGGATYTLTVDSGDESDNHLDIETGNVTIRATGEERAIIDASSLENPDMVLHIFGDANVNLENLTITGGVAEGNDSIGVIGEGGGLFIGDTSRVTITNSLITGNSATAVGGGISSSLESTVTLIDSEVSNNQAGNNGGGIISRSNNFTIVNSLITGNSATGATSGNTFARGGGIVVAYGATNIINTTIAENSSQEGGGIAVTNAEANIHSSTISNNTSSNSGGGIDVIESSRDRQPLVTVANSTISGNVSGSFGGGVYFNYSTLFENGADVVISIENSTITNNTANTNIDNITGGAGGGIGTGQSNRIAVQNSIVTGNIDGRNNTPSDVSGFFYTDLIFEDSERGVVGNGNNIIGTLDRVTGTIGNGSDIVGVDPLLSPLQDNGGATLTHALLENSPAIDAGNNESIPADILDLDGDGNTAETIPIDQTGSDRIFNQTVDVGAVEFGSTSNNPSTPDDDSNIVYRFFNNDTGVHFYTANETERDAVLELNNFSFEGGSYQAVDPLTGNPEPSPVYRFLNEDTGVHLYTISEVERDATQELSNYSFEGEAFSAYGTEVEDSIPIYRFFNPTTGAHFYTPSEAERDNVEDNLTEFQSEGIAYYALPLDE